MMDRNALMGMLGSLPTDKLLAALSTGAGVQMPGMGVEDPMGSNHIKGWGTRSVPYKGGSDRPPISSKAWAQMTINTDRPEAMAQNDANTRIIEGMASKPGNEFLGTK